MTDGFPTLHEIYGFLAALFGLICYLPYIVTLVKRESKPHVYSWLIWGLQGLVFYFAESSAGSGPGAWINVTCGGFCFLIGLSAFHYGEKQITFSDTCSFILALLSIVAWALTDNPLMAVVFACTADICAYYPTFRKSWHKPFEENLFTYNFYLVASIFGMMAVENVNATTMTGYIVLFILCGAFSLMSYWRRFVLSRADAASVLSPLPAA